MDCQLPVGRASDILALKYTRLQTVWSLPDPSRQANKGHSPTVTVAPTAPVGSLIRSFNLPHSLQRGVPSNQEDSNNYKRALWSHSCRPITAAALCHQLPGITLK